MNLKGSNLMIFSPEQMQRIVQNWLYMKMNIENPVVSVVYSEREQGFIVELEEVKP